MALWRAAKKNGSYEGRMAYQLIEQKRSRLKQNTLLTEAFKPGTSPCLFVKKIGIEKFASKLAKFFIMVIRVVFAWG